MSYLTYSNEWTPFTENYFNYIEFRRHLTRFLGSGLRCIKMRSGVHWIGKRPSGRFTCSMKNDYLRGSGLCTLFSLYEELADRYNLPDLISSAYEDNERKIIEMLQLISSDKDILALTRFVWPNWSYKDLNNYFKSSLAALKRIYRIR